MSNELTDVRCPCGAEFQADSYDAGFIAGSGMCQNCDAAMPPKDIPAPVEQAGTNVGHGHVFPRADGVKMRCGGPELCSECAADAYRARAALAEVERLRESKGDPSGSFDRCMKMMYERDENAKRLDAALARVAELTATRNRYGVDAHYFNKNLQRILRDFESFTPDELARSLIILAKVADEKVVAQHSVPELDQSRSALTEAQMRRLYENSTDIENERLGFAAFARLMRRAEAVHQIAAAPSQAQHSVPEGWMLVECGIWTQEQVDEMQKTVARFRNSEFVDDRALAMAVADAGQCKAPEISLAELLAAAPGKEGL